MKVNKLGILGLFQLALLQAAFPTASGASALVSDIDDTIRVSHVESFWSVDLVWTLLTTRKAFSGMSTLYQEMERNSGLPADRSLTFVSAAPYFFRTNVELMLRETGFNATSVILKSQLATTFNYKLSTIRSLMDARIAEDPTSTFVFLGDDTEVDQYAYAALERANPEHVRATYIRRVSNRNPSLLGGADVRENQSYFTTAFDVAVSELSHSRMSEEQAIRVGLATLSDPDQEAFFPAWMACPSSDYLSDSWVEGYSYALREIAFRIRSRVGALCGF